MAMALAAILRLIPGYDPWANVPAGWYLDEAAAQQAINFFPMALRHVEGVQHAGKPITLEPWQQAIIGNLFGWRRPDGTRRYREAFVFVPRKNGKTTVAAGVALYVLYCDGEPGAQIYAAAADREQAMLVFRAAAGMVAQSPELAALARIYKTAKSMSVGTGVFKAISSEANTKHGYNTHLAVIDELHAQPDRDLVDVLTTSTGARTQPLIVHITTSDYARESICNEKYDYACKVRDGIISDPSFLPVIYEAKATDDWRSPATWATANPNLGVSLSEDYLARECQRAVETPAYENTFKRLHLNIRTEQDVRLIPMDQWAACSAVEDPAEWRERMAEELAGQPCFGGLDLSTVRDVSCFSLWFYERNLVLPWFFVPRKNAEVRERRDRVPYVSWGAQGFVDLTDGNTIDYAKIESTILECGAKYHIRDIGADKWNLEYIRQRLEGCGAEIIEFQQNQHDMSAPTKHLLTLIEEGTLEHGNNPVLRWMASNVAGIVDANENIRPCKKTSKERIDGIVALIMAIGRAIASPPDSDSVYEERGLLRV